MRRAELRSSGALRLAAGYAAITCASLAALLLAVLVLVDHDTREQTREAIEQDVRQLSIIYAEGGRDQVTASIGILAGSIEAQRSVYALADESGRIVAGSDRQIAVFTGWREISLPRTSKKPDRFLVFGTRLDGLTLLVGRRTHTEQEVRASVLHAFLLAMACVWPFALATGLWLSRRAFARIDAIAAAIRSFVGGQLAVRAGASGRGDELDLLAGDINAALDRIEQLVTNLRQISSDLAHDLKTPLGRLRNKLDAALVEAGQRGVLRGDAFLASSIADIDAILRTFDSLLLIAEIDSGAARARFAPVALRGVVEQIAEVYGGVAEEAGHRLTVSAAEDCTVAGERSLLVQLLANLIENAIRHTPKGTPIALGLRAGTDTATLVVSDGGAGIDADEHERVFRRFYRSDQSRKTPGSGLGLAIVKAIAELHRGSVALGDNAPGLRVEITLPTIALNPRRGGSASGEELRQ